MGRVGFFRLRGVCAFALVVALTGTVFAADGGGGKTEEGKRGMVSAQGSASVSVMPDVAYVGVGLMTTAATAALAQADNAKQFDTLMKALKAVGVKDEDVKTSNYYVYAQYDYTFDKETGAEKSKVREYVCGDTVTITVNDVNDAAKIVDAAGLNGATQINSVQFGVKNSSAAYEQALEKAYNAALRSAKAMARAAGVTLDPVPLSIQETGYNTAPAYYGNVKAMNDAAAAEAPESVPTRLYVSELEVYASVSVSFGY